MVKFVEGLNILFFSPSTSMRIVKEEFNCKYKEVEVENVFDKEFIESLYNDDSIVLIYFRYIKTLEEFYYQIVEEFRNQNKPISSTIIAFVPYIEGKKFNNIYSMLKCTLSFVNSQNKIRSFCTNNSTIKYRSELDKIIPGYYLSRYESNISKSLVSHNYIANYKFIFENIESTGMKKGILVKAYSKDDAKDLIIELAKKIGMKAVDIRIDKISKDTFLSRNTLNKFQD